MNKWAKKRKEKLVCSIVYCLGIHIDVLRAEVIIRTKGGTYFQAQMLFEDEEAFINLLKGSTIKKRIKEKVELLTNRYLRPDLAKAFMQGGNYYIQKGSIRNYYDRTNHNYLYSVMELGNNNELKIDKELIKTDE